MDTPAIHTLPASSSNGIHRTTLSHLLVRNDVRKIVPNAIAIVVDAADSDTDDPRGRRDGESRVQLIAHTANAERPGTVLINSSELLTYTHHTPNHHHHDCIYQVGLEGKIWNETLV